MSLKTCIWVKQKRSISGCTEYQKNVLKGIGLGRIGQERILKDTLPIRGMVEKVQHLLDVEVRKEV